MVVVSDLMPLPDIFTKVCFGELLLDHPSGKILAETCAAGYVGVTFVILGTVQPL